MEHREKRSAWTTSQILSGGRSDSPPLKAALSLSQGDQFHVLHRLHLGENLDAIHLEHGIYKGLGASWTVRFQKREGQYNNAEGEVADYQPVWLLDGSVYWQNKYLRVSADCTNMTNSRYYDYGGILQPGAWAKVSIKAKLY